MGADLARAHWTWNDIGDRLPFVQFVQMVVHAPPNTAVYQALSEGYGVAEHHLTTLVELASYLAWAKTKSAAEGQKPPDFSLPRPGKKPVEPESVMTIGDYMRLSGMEG